jgi:hypothetical protein
MRPHIEFWIRKRSLTINLYSPCNDFSFDYAFHPAIIIYHIRRKRIFRTYKLNTAGVRDFENWVFEEQTG